MSEPLVIVLNWYHIIAGFAGYTASTIIIDYFKGKYEQKLG